MSNFHNKQFKGKSYTFGHLQPMQMKVPLDSKGSLVIDMHVTFGCHCFTEEFDQKLHRPDHRYTYKGELRAFEPLRYECSLQLPALMQSLLKGTIYNADQSYTYVGHIALASFQGPQSYSIFFNLKKDTQSTAPAVRMFVKSAYLKPLVATANAQNWRFASLAGQIAQAFPPKKKKPKPVETKKKTP